MIHPKFHVYMTVLLAVLTLQFAGLGEEGKVLPLLRVGVEGDDPRLPWPGLDTREEGFVLSAYPTGEVLMDLPKVTKPLNVDELPDIVPIFSRFCENTLAIHVDKGLIEPLDSLFEEMGVDPAELLQPAILEAVTYKGKIWALPAHIEFYLVAYNPMTMATLSINPDFASWEEMFDAAEKISDEAVEKRKIAGWKLGRWYKEDIVPCAAWFSRSLHKDARFSQSMVDLFTEYNRREVFRSDEDNWYMNEELEEKHALWLTLLRDCHLDKNKGFSEVPALLSRNDEEPVPPIALLESYAIRKNDPVKLAAARRFLQWFLKVETQKEMMDQNNRRSDRTAEIQHLPLYKHCWDAPLFQNSRFTYPNIEILLDIIDRAYLFPADPVHWAPQREALMTRIGEVLASSERDPYLGKHGMFMRTLPYTEPDGPVTAPAAGSSFDPY
ncbi:MAG: extracellular solute-binding protein [Candidatus Hydrogenedens sp.]|nr:extracellular solute-binding protein [Candidatus Hydrogenedens sp.]